MMACMDDKALTAAALELYALPLDEFVAARTAAAKASPGTGKELPAAIKALPKPSVAAWTVNMMAAHEPGVLARLADLGQRMRAAQASLDAAAMRELGRERRSLLAAAANTARTVAEQQGRDISATIATDVEKTLAAAIADEGAAAAVQSGLLVQTLSADGVDSVDLDGAMAVPGAVRVPPTAPPSTSAPPPATPSKGKKQEEEKRTTAAAGPRTSADQPRLKAVREAPRPPSPTALEKAKAALAEARDAAEESSRRAAERHEQMEEAEVEVADLIRETRDLRARLKTAEEELDKARKQQAITAAEVKQALRAAEKDQRTAVLAQERVLRLGNTRE